MSDIKYNIEKVYIDKIDEKVTLILSGWGYSQNQFEFEVSQNNILRFDLANNDRPDVADYLGLEKPDKLGFELKIKEFDKKAPVTVKLKNASGEECVSFDNIENLYEQYNENKETVYKKLRKMRTALKRNIKVLGVKGTVKKIIRFIFNGRKTETNCEKQRQKYEFKEIDIPLEWIDIQKRKVSFAIIIEVNEISEYFYQGIKSLMYQPYDNFKVYIISDNEMKRKIEKGKFSQLGYIFLNKEEFNLNDKFHKLLNYINEDYMVKYCLKDILSKNTLVHFLEEINLNMNSTILYGNYDRVGDKKEFFTPVIKTKFINNSNINIITSGIYAVKVIKNNDEKSYEEYLNNIINKKEEENIVYIDKVLLHKRVCEKEKEERKTSKAIAFYLPQFHETPENNKWWGEGFTEWTNVKRAVPMFANHNQPRVPSYLSYYDLDQEKDIQYKQIDLAKKYNVYGFCYYYYWFNGKKLLYKPLDNVLNNKDLDLPFCICWANENWTKRWDGLEQEILIEQVHEEDSDERFIKDIIDILKDPRYIRINGKPLLLIYKIHLLKNGEKTIKLWREKVKEFGLDDIHVCIVKHPQIATPKEYGADSMVEFPPHNMSFDNITSEITKPKKDFIGGVYDYSTIIDKLDKTVYDFTFFKGCMLQWDNTARRMEQASIFHNFTIEGYEKWLLACKDYVETFNKEEEQLVFINAWNEWAEGTYLEPDKKYGFKYLEATKKIMESR